MSPLVRAWLAARLPDLVDHGYAIWRGTLHALTCRACRSGEFALCEREWDPTESARVRCEICGKDNRLPAPGNGETVTAGQPGTAVATLGPPSPAFNLMLPCSTCGAHANAPCVNRYGEATGPHKCRRDAATAAGVLGGAS